MKRNNRKVRLTLDPEVVVRVTENHGGYLAGRCEACGVIGWLEGRLGLRYGDYTEFDTWLKHKKACPINKVIDHDRKGKLISA